MKTETRDLARFEMVVDALGSVADHYKRGSRVVSDGMYYELLHQYYSRILTAKEEGKYLACHNSQIPSEIFYAMDIIPVFLEGSSVIMTVLQKNYEEVFQTAKDLGYAPEICSVTRAILATYISGWMPQTDMVVWSNQPCDNNVKTGDPIAEAYGIPMFYIDAPYHFEERDVRYFAEELEDLAAFLEQVTRKSFNVDRLIEALHLTQQSLDLEREIYRLRGTVPSPLGSRKPRHLISTGRNYMGTQTAVDYFTQVLVEAKEMIAEGEGAVPNERFRLMDFFPVPNHNWKILDWMEQEYGACIVADPLNFHWEEFDWDFSQPFTTLARRVMYHPNSYPLCGPLSQGFARYAVEDAREHKVDGAIWWADSRCRQGCAAIRVVKDALRDEAGIPTVVLDVDPVDPTVTSNEQLQEKLETFFELLEERD